MADIDKVFFKVEGMVERGVFELWYTPSVISLNKIFEKIKALGEERNLPYKGLVIPMK